MNNCHCVPWPQVGHFFKTRASIVKLPWTTTIQLAAWPLLIHRMSASFVELVRSRLQYTYRACYEHSTIPFIATCLLGISSWLLRSACPKITQCTACAENRKNGHSSRQHLWSTFIPSRTMVVLAGILISLFRFPCQGYTIIPFPVDNPEISIFRRFPSRFLKSSFNIVLIFVAWLLHRIYFLVKAITY